MRGGLLFWGVVALAALSSPADPPVDEYALLLTQTIAAGSEPEFEGLFDELVAQHQARLDAPESIAQIEVLEQLAEIEAAREQWREAAGRLSRAINLAEALALPDRLLDLYYRQAEWMIAGGRRDQAIEKLIKTRDLARLSDRPARQIQANLLLLHQRHRQGIWERFESDYDTLLALPGADRFAIELHRAEHTPRNPPDRAISRWEQIRELAKDRSDRVSEATALDQIGSLHLSADRLDEAYGHFTAADALQSGYQRPFYISLEYSDFLGRRGEPERAAAVLQQALDRLETSPDPALAAELRTHRADRLAETGDFATAYAELRLAHQNLQKQVRPSIVSPVARIVPFTPQEDVDQAALLAAARTALREAELAATRQQRNTTLFLAAAILFLAIALGVAYHFKRQAAAALAIARDAAELRAERTRWQMLRYQLNPHFLFNALTSLSGLVLSDPRAARDAIGRLSQFCRYALHRSTEDLLTVEEEFEQIRAFLDVEQAGLGDRLHVNIDLDPAVQGCLLPPLLLQPLAENALKYGSDSPAGRLEMKISASADPESETLVLEVANSGAWVEPAAEPLERDPVGLKNVRERLAKFNPREDAFATDSRDGWVRVRVRLPLKLNRPENAATS